VSTGENPHQQDQIQKVSGFAPQHFPETFRSLSKYLSRIAIATDDRNRSQPQQHRMIAKKP